MRNTLFFVLGISFAFFLLGFGFTAIGQFFHNYRTWFTRIGGIIVVLFGLYQLGLFGSAALSKERRLRFQPDALAMNPLTALILGFTFSFAWTPCVGPALASVLLLAASSSSSFTAWNLYFRFCPALSRRRAVHQCSFRLFKKIPLCRKIHCKARRNPYGLYRRHDVYRLDEWHKLLSFRQFFLFFCRGKQRAKRDRS